MEAVDWVQTAALCDRLHCLPKPGGLFDQDPRHIRKLSTVLRALDEKHEEDIKHASNEAKLDRTTKNATTRVTRGH